MSKERAQRRAAREAAAARRVEASRAAAEKLVARRRRRERFRRALRSVLPWTPGQRWSRHTRAQRGGTGVAVVGILVLIWLNTGSWPLRIASVLAAILIVPALLTLFFDRSSK